MRVPSLAALRRALLCLPLLAAPAAAQSPRDELVVTPAWLAAHLNDPKLVLLHMGEAAEYPQAHIPGARLIRLSDISQHGPNDLHLQMLPPEELRRRLESFGISDDSRIVVYYGNDWVSPSTRVVFTLDYAGLGARTSLLDGGMAAWRAAGHPVTTVVPSARRGALRPLRMRDLVVDAAWLRGHLNTPRTAVIDGRAAVFYDGVEATERRLGHVPGARSIPFTEITDEQLKLRSPQELAVLFRAAGIHPGDTIVGYCHVGQQATAVLFAARTLGYDVRLYDGSFQEWGGREDLPVETAAPTGARR